MNASAQAAHRGVEAHRDVILETERHLWKHPEPGFREWKTHAYLKEKYEQLGYTLHEMGNIPGFYVDIDTGRPGPCVAVFGEMDSLIIPTHPDCDPETGAVHACGHNCQSAALLGIAAGLAAPGALDDLSGRIRLIAVPAEEAIELDFREELRAQGVIRYLEGKQEFMYRGVLDGVDMAFMTHTADGNLFSGNAGGNGAIVKTATFIGKSAHAGATPHLGRNALYAASCALQAANSLRETFRDADHIRFHPIITEGGTVVNAIPDRVVVESYVRGATMEGIFRENKRLNRAFAGAAAALGCRLHLHDQYGFGVRHTDPGLADVFREVGVEMLGAERTVFGNNWAAGSTDLGDVSCVMPVQHAYIGGASGNAHTTAYRIADPELACVESAKLQCAVLALLLGDGAARARRVLAEGRHDYPTIREHLARMDATTIDKEVVLYQEDGTITLDA